MVREYKLGAAATVWPEAKPRRGLYDEMTLTIGGITLSTSDTLWANPSGDLMAEYEKLSAASKKRTHDDVADAMAVAMSQFNASTATGSALDRIASIYGLGSGAIDDIECYSPLCPEACYHRGCDPCPVCVDWLRQLLFEAIVDAVFGWTS